METLRKVLLILNIVLTWIASVTIFVIISSVGRYLVKVNIVQFDYFIIEQLYYAGLGVLSYFPINYMYNTLKKN